MTAHVICANDSVEFVVIGTYEQAMTKLRALAEENFEAVKWNYMGSSGNVYNGSTPYEKYRNHVYWHIHTVGLEDSRERVA